MKQGPLASQPIVLLFLPNLSEIPAIIHWRSPVFAIAHPFFLLLIIL